jgi:hypothetical protein
MPHHVNQWIELTVVVILALYLFRPRRKPPSHPMPSHDKALLLRRLLAHKRRNGCDSIAVYGKSL